MSKQVIVIRKDLNMRKGKMCAQAAHASLAALLSQGYHEKPDTGLPILVVPLEPELEEWLNGSFTKIVVGVNSESELLEIFDHAQNAHLIRSIIKDEGRTEFGGRPTYTAVAVGPGKVEDIDKITGHLDLL